jgi:hypothetical protein
LKLLTGDPPAQQRRGRTVARRRPDDLARLSDLTVQLSGGGARGEMDANLDELWIGVGSQ